jgi:hypothetical protein
MLDPGAQLLNASCSNSGDYTRIRLTTIRTSDSYLALIAKGRFTGSAGAR